MNLNEFIFDTIYFVCKVLSFILYDKSYSHLYKLKNTYNKTEISTVHCDNCAYFSKYIAAKL